MVDWKHGIPQAKSDNQGEMNSSLSIRDLTKSIRPCKNFCICPIPRKLYAPDLSLLLIYFSQPMSKNCVNIFIPGTFSPFSEKRVAHKKEDTLRFFTAKSRLKSGWNPAGTHIQAFFILCGLCELCGDKFPVCPFCVHRLSVGLFAFGNHCTQPYSKVK